MSRKEIFVFGAGASHASGHMPLGRDLVWMYYPTCSGLYRIENGRPAKEDLKEKRIEFINYEKFLQLADITFPGLNACDKWHKNMEEGQTFPIPFL